MTSLLVSLLPHLPPHGNHNDWLEYKSVRVTPLLWLPLRVHPLSSRNTGLFKNWIFYWDPCRITWVVKIIQKDPCTLSPISPNGNLVQSYNITTRILTHWYNPLMLLRFPNFTCICVCVCMHVCVQFPVNTRVSTITVKILKSSTITTRIPRVLYFYNHTHFPLLPTSLILGNH